MKKRNSTRMDTKKTSGRRQEFIGSGKSRSECSEGDSSDNNAPQNTFGSVGRFTAQVKYVAEDKGAKNRWRGWLILIQHQEFQEPSSR